MEEIQIVGNKPDTINNFRENVRIILYNPATGLFALQYSGLTGFYGTLGGGVEPGDTVLETVAKELREETGYTDYTIVTQLGGQIRAYYKDGEGVNKERLSTPFLLNLNSGKNVGTSLDANEILRQVKTVWLSYPECIEIFEGLISFDHATIYHYEIFKRGLKHMGFLES
jgi:8-oxo-dGTP pyrophosphatase MutT (NUDIX family)